MFIFLCSPYELMWECTIFAWFATVFGDFLHCDKCDENVITHAIHLSFIPCDQMKHLVTVWGSKFLAKSVLTVFSWHTLQVTTNKQAVILGHITSPIFVGCCCSIVICHIYRPWCVFWADMNIHDLWAVADLFGKFSLLTRMHVINHKWSVRKQRLHLQFSDNGWNCFTVILLTIWQTQTHTPPKTNSSPTVTVVS